MTGPSPQDIRIARAQRNVAMVILGTFAVWLPMQGLAVWLDLPVRLMGLLDLVALAALAFALIMLFRARRLRREKE